LRCSIGLPGGSAGERRPQEGARCSGQWEEPRRGTKPREDRASSHRQRCGEVADPTTEQRLEAEGARVIRHARRANGKGATAAVTRCGCRRGMSFEGYRIHVARSVRASPEPLRWSPGAVRETQRTPGSAAGCNKPANPGAEETAEVVRNHEGGTGLARVAPRWPKRDGHVAWEWTLTVMSMEGWMARRPARDRFCADGSQERKVAQALASAVRPGRSASAPNESEGLEVRSLRRKAGRVGGERASDAGWATGNRKGGAQERPTTCERTVHGSRPSFVARRATETPHLEGPVNSRELRFGNESTADRNARL
jgi:hypothetical protein